VTTQLKQHLMVIWHPLHRLPTAREFPWKTCKHKPKRKLEPTTIQTSHHQETRRTKKLLKKATHYLHHKDPTRSESLFMT
jgi:hypothetical protein